MIDKREAIRRLVKDQVNKASGGSAGNVEIEGFYIEMTATGMRIKEVRTVQGLHRGRPEDAILVEGIPRPDLGSMHHRLRWLPCTRTYAEMANPDSNTIAKVTSEFEINDESFGDEIVTPGEVIKPELEFSSTVQMEETNQFYYGDGNDNVKDIVLSQNITLEGSTEPTEVNISPIVEFPIAMTEFTYRRQEPSRRRVGSHGTISAGDIARLYVGTLNDRSVFQNDPKYSWLCTAIVGASNDGGTTYHMAYQFQHHPTRLPMRMPDGNYEFVGGWCRLVGIPDDNGYPRPDLIQGDGTLSHPGGKAVVRLTRSSNFNDLQLTL